jgi:hypothetical protein
MTNLQEAREALAFAVSDAGLTCLPYPPENPSPPLGFVDDLAMDFTGGGGFGTFCLPGSATATIVTIALRNDRAGAMQYLEGLIGPILEALYAIQGVRVVSAGSGQMSVGGQDLPAVTYTVSFLV